MTSEAAESAASYTIGGVGFSIAHLADVGSAAQSITLILACLVVMIRLAHDGLKLYRYVKGKQ